MDISKRLKVIVNMIEDTEIIADIGTDHAYVPIDAIKNNKCKKAIASDINKGPIEKAKKNILNNNLQKQIECRLGGGFSTLRPKEVDVAVIAGMGGNLIRDIIDDDIEIFKELDYVILQPTQNPEVIREYIYNKGFEIKDEDLCKDEGIYYEYIKVKFAQNKCKLDDLYYEISKILIDKKHPLIKEFIEYKISKLKNVLGYIKKDTESSKNRKKEIKAKIERLEGVLKCI